MSNFNDLVLAELVSAQSVLNDFLNNPTNIQKIVEASDLMVDAVKNGGKILSCGNGGSSCDAMHFAEELTGKYRKNRPAIPAISISEAGHITCVGNDFGFDFVFSRYVEALGSHNDVLLAISTSGNSKNVIEAMKTAKLKGLKSVALTGNEGGRMAGLADLEIRVPHIGFADRIQEVHIKVIHILMMLIEKKLGYVE